MDNLILQITKAKQHLSLIYFRNLSLTELPARQCDLVLFRDWPATFLSDVIIGPLPLAIRVVQNRNAGEASKSRTGTRQTKDIHKFKW